MSIISSWKDAAQQIASDLTRREKVIIAVAAPVVIGSYALACVEFATGYSGLAAFNALIPLAPMTGIALIISRAQGRAPGG